MSFIVDPNLPFSDQGLMSDYTFRGLKEDPATGLCSFMLANDFGKPFVFQGTYEQLEPIARRYEAWRTGQSFESVKTQRLDKPSTLRAMTSLAIDFAPLILAATGACVGSLCPGGGTAAGAAAGFKLGSLLSFMKSTTETVSGYDYISGRDVEGLHRALSCANAVFNGFVVARAGKVLLQEGKLGFNMFMRGTLRPQRLLNLLIKRQKQGYQKKVVFLRKN